MRASLLSGAASGNLTRAQTDIGDRPSKIGPSPGLRFTDEVKRMRKSVIEDAEARRKRNEEHEKLMKQMYDQQEGILRRTAMAEASKDDPNMINNLLDMMKKQAQETDDVTIKMQEYFDEAE